MADPMNRIIGCLNDAIDWSNGKTTTRIHAYGKTYEFTRAEYDAFLLGRASSPAPSLPTREEIARVLRESRIIYYDSYDRRMRIGLHGDSDVTEKVERLTAAILALFAQPQEKKTTSVEPPPSP